MPKYRLIYSEKAEIGFKKFEKAGNKIALKKISKLLKEIAEHPKTGTGHPEQLKYRENCWSRRIDKEHRLVYDIEEEVVIVLIISAYGHYDEN